MNTKSTITISQRVQSPYHKEITVSVWLLTNQHRSAASVPSRGQIYNYYSFVLSSGHFRWHLSNRLTYKLGKPDSLWIWHLKFSSYLERGSRCFCAENVTTSRRLRSLEIFSKNIRQAKVWKSVIMLVPSLKIRCTDVSVAPRHCKTNLWENRKSFKMSSRLPVFKCDIPVVINIR